MKELSIEEKAKRYDEALKIINDYYQKTKYSSISNASTDREVLEKAFPELKENEDDEIRKELIDFFSSSHATDTFRGIPWDRIVAWLEKQGEQKQDVNIQINPSEYVNDMGGNGCYLKNTTSEIADIVEPKFKVGDWVVSPNGVYWHIDGIEDNRYQVSATTGECADWPLDTVLYHLWTIQDAKDGDVLSYRDGQWVFIFKNMIDDTTFKYHALISEKDFAINDSAYTVLPSCIVPATKEQRNLLFQKMKEAGYEWDAEKKKLKKVELKPTEEWYDFIRWFVKQRTNDYTLIPSDDDIHKWGDNILNHARKVLEQKPVWSEEDERFLNGAINVLNASKVYTKSPDKYEDTINWLKSLRHKSTWKPSDEQMLAINTAINIVGKENISGRYLIELYEQLKKLIKE